MIIYNVTTNIDNSVHDQWVLWMKETHIPNILATGKFIKAKMCKVMIEEDMGGVTYSVQYTVSSKTILEAYYKENADTLQGEMMRKFPNKYVAFRTELEVISEL